MSNYNESALVASASEFNSKELFTFDYEPYGTMVDPLYLAMTSDQVYLNAKGRDKYINKMVFKGNIVHFITPKGIECKYTRNIQIKEYMKLKDYFFSCEENIKKFFDSIAKNPYLIKYVSPEKAAEYSQDYLLLAKEAVSNNPLVFHEINVTSPIIAPFIEEFVTILTDPKHYKIEFIGYNSEEDWEKNAKLIFSVSMDKPTYNRVANLLSSVPLRKLCLLKYVDVSMLNDPVTKIKNWCLKNPGEFEYIKFTGVTADLIRDYYTLAKWYLITGSSFYNRMKNIHENCLTDKEYYSLAMIGAKRSHNNLYYVNFDNPEINAINLLRLGLWSKEFEKTYSFNNEKNLIPLILHKVKNQTIKRIFVKRFLTYRPYLIDKFGYEIMNDNYESFLIRHSKNYPYLILYTKKSSAMNNKELVLNAIKYIITSSTSSFAFPDDVYHKIKCLNEYEFYHYAATVARDHYIQSIKYYKNIDVLRKIQRLMNESLLTKKQKKSISCIINPLIYS